MKKLIIMALLASGLWAIDQPKFSEYDLNNDGKITQSELEEARSIRVKQRAEEGRMLRNEGEVHSFEQMDINKDGSISEEEFHLHQSTLHRTQACATFG